MVPVPTLHIETKYSNSDEAEEKDTVEDRRCYDVAVHVSSKVRLPEPGTWVFI